MDLKHLSDEQIISGLKSAVIAERESLIDVLLHLNEFEERKLSEKLKHASTYRYCVDVLGLAAHAAYKRIAVARLIERFPDLRDGIRDGSICLESAMIMAPRLRKDNATELISQARGKSTVEVQFLVAARAPRPDVRETVRAEIVPVLPTAADPSPAGEGTKPRAGAENGGGATCARSPATPPGLDGSADRIRIGLTVDKRCYEALERVRSLMWHKNPAAKLEHALNEAVQYYLDKKDPQRRAERDEATKRQAPPWRSSDPIRRIPQVVKDEVWRRDAGQCAFIKPDGSRCPERKSLEYDHVIPFALGGPSNNPANIRLLCWGHNQMEARRRFGVPVRRGDARAPASGEATA